MWNDVAGPPPHPIFTQHGRPARAMTGYEGKFPNPWPGFPSARWSRDGHWLYVVVFARGPVARW
jgi:hypothetical protein